MIKKLKYPLRGIGVLGILILGTAAGFLFLGKDEPSPDDSDLWLPKLEVLEEENGYYYFNQFLEKAEYPFEEINTDFIRDIAEGKEWDKEFVEELIKEQKEILYYYEKILQTSQYHNPNLLDPNEVSIFTPLIPYGGLRSIARLSALKAELLFRNGEQKEAFEECLKIIRLGDMLEEGRNGLVGLLTGIRVKETGLSVFRRLSAMNNLSQKNLKSYIDELNQYYLKREGLVNSVKFEYIDLTNTKKELIDPIAQSSFFDKEVAELERRSPWWERFFMRSNYFYKPNQTQRIFADHFRLIIDRLKKNYYKEAADYEVQNYFKSDPFGSSFSWELLTMENSAGKLLYDMMAVSTSGFLRIKCLEDFSVTGTQLLMALKAYQLENGKLPNFLDELVPNYISEIPKDPFDGESIRYDPDKKIIYSVGADLMDSGGSEGEDWQEMPDPTFKIEF